jgi:hypothetical protein
MVQGQVRLRLFNQDEVVLAPDEVFALLRHRTAMLAYFGAAVILVLLNWDGPGAADLPLELRMAAQLGGVLIGMGALVAGLALANRKARRGQDVVVRASRLFLLAATLGLMSSSLLHASLGIKPLPSLSAAAADIAFNYLLAEILGGLSAHFVAPVVLAELRAKTAAPPQGPTRLERPDGIRPVRVANRQFHPADILRLRAERTHVVLTTREGRQTLPGPFSAVVAQMPPDLGQQISRADWIATSAVREMRQDGRDTLIYLQDNEVLRIPASRRAKLGQWLSDLSSHHTQRAV